MCLTAKTTNAKITNAKITNKTKRPRPAHPAAASSWSAGAALSINSMPSKETTPNRPPVPG